MKNETDCQWNRRSRTPSRQSIINVIGSQTRRMPPHDSKTAHHLHHRPTPRNSKPLGHHSRFASTLFTLPLILTTPKNSLLPTQSPIHEFFFKPKCNVFNLFSFNYLFKLKVCKILQLKNSEKWRLGSNIELKSSNNTFI